MRFVGLVGPNTPVIAREQAVNAAAHATDVMTAPRGPRNRLEIAITTM
jgi:hypothetical protein